MASVAETTRITGLTSGLDIESLVKAAATSTKTAINSRKQKLQTLEWKQEAYRSVISAMSTFQQKYLDLTSKTSIRANSVMKSNKAESSNDKLVAQASASATAAKYSITSVSTATAATLAGTKASSGNVELDFSNAAAGENKVTVTLDGAVRTVTFNGGENAKENFLTAINETFDSISAAEFSFKDGSNKLTIENASGDNVSHIFKVGYSEAVGLKNDASNTISTSSTIGSLDFAQPLSGSSFEFSINGKSFSFTKDTTIKDMMNTINKSDAGVKMSFSGLTQAFTLETTATGAGQELDISQTSGNLVNSLFNVDSTQIGLVPTTASGLTEKTVDDSVVFQFNGVNSGFDSDDSIIINGKALGITGLTKTQETENIKLTSDSSEISAKLSTDAGGNTIYSYKQDGSTYYAKKIGENSYETVMQVKADGSVNVNGADIEDTTEDAQLSALGIEKKYKTYSDSEIKTALEEAYKASFPEGNGSFTVSSVDDEVQISFSPAAGEITAAAATGSITLDATAYGGTDSVYTNYSEVSYGADKVISDSNVSFSVNGSSNITIAGTGTDGGVTIGDLVNSGYFEYDADNGTLSVKGTDRLSVTTGTEEIKALFGTSELVGKDNVGTMNITGTNAQITINGVVLESASNSFAVDGTTFNIGDVKSFTQADIDAGTAEEITVNVAKDTSKIKDTILEFVTAYNDMLDAVHKQLNTSRPKSNGDYYDPLTEEQEDEMDADEIEKWNESAKTGLLYHDSALSKVFTKLRQVSSTVCGGMTIHDLGIDTSDDFNEYGKLKIDDESVLDAAIEKYGEEIANFFTDTENGFGTALNNAVNSAIDTSMNTRGYAKGSLTSLAGVENTRSDTQNMLYTQISSMKTLIDSLNDRYENQQTRLWKRYSTLESYISNMNNQSTSLFGTTTS